MAEATSNAYTPVNAAYRVGHGRALRAASATTTSYVATNYARCIDADFVSFDFALVWVDSTSTEWYVVWSGDGTTFYRDTANAVVAGAATVALSSNTIANAATVNWNDGPYRVRDNYVALYVKKTGGVGADTLGVTVNLLIQKAF